MPMFGSSFNGDSMELLNIMGRFFGARFFIHICNMLVHFNPI